jgi:hypothetical protein
MYLAQTSFRMVSLNGTGKITPKFLARTSVSWESSSGGLLEMYRAQS